MLGVSWIISLMSMLVGGLALFNLTRKTFDIGLNGVVRDLISYYQNIFYPIIEFLNNKVDWIIPEWDRDLIMLIVFIIAINSRSMACHLMEAASESWQEYSNDKKGYISSIKLGVIAAFLFLTGSNSLIREKPYSVVLATAAATLLAFVSLLTVTIFIPYVRVVMSFLIITSTVIFLAHMLKLVEGEASFTNKKIFTRHYIGALVGLALFFALNLYAPAPTPVSG